MSARSPSGAARRHREHPQRHLAEDAITEHGTVQIDDPRDRDERFVVRKHQRRFQGFDEKILALYSRGLSTRDIEAHLEEIYGVRVGRDLISRVADAVMDDVEGRPSGRWRTSWRSSSSTAS